MIRRITFGFHSWRDTMESGQICIRSRHAQYDQRKQSQGRGNDMYATVRLKGQRSVVTKDASKTVEKPTKKAAGKIKAPLEAKPGKPPERR